MAERALAWLSSAFSFAALGLAIMAVHGTLAYAIAQGRREIGIRIALGARFSNVLVRSAARPILAIGSEFWPESSSFPE